MSAHTLFWMTVSGWLLAGATATGAKVLRDFSRHELEEYCRRRRNPDRMDEVLDHYEQLSIAAETLLMLVASVTVVSGFHWLGMVLPNEPMHSWIALAEWVGAIGTMLVLLSAVAIWIPWSVVEFASGPFLYHTWRLWRLIGWFFSPLSLGAALAEEMMQRLTGTPENQHSEEEAFEDEIRSIVTEGLREGHLEADAREMIEAVIELGDVDVGDIMTPSTKVDALDLSSASWNDVVSFVTTCGRTRIPVYEEKLDRIVGILYAKDLLPELSKPPAEQCRDVRPLLRKPTFVPKSKRADDLLRDFLRMRNHLALVVDEFHAIAGVVTIEDVLEEIVGEIVDEYDEEEEVHIRQIDEHSAEVSGAAHIEEINEQLGIDLPDDEEYDTIAGLVLMHFGRIPRRDELFERGTVRIIVLDANRRKIERVKIEILERNKSEPA